MLTLTVNAGTSQAGYGLQAESRLKSGRQLLPAFSCPTTHCTEKQRPGGNLKAITPPTIKLKTAILLPLALALAVLVAGFTSAYLDQEREFSQEYNSTLFSTVPHIFDSAITADTDTLSAALELITRDDGLHQALIARDREYLLRRANPIFNKLREKYGITHFYFTGPDRINIMRIHQPNRYGDKIERVTTTKAMATGKPAAGLELGPLGTFTLRVVFPCYDGDRLIGFIELGEEIEHLLQRIKDISGIDLYVAIDKRYLSQKSWAAGMRMLGRHGEWDLLPDSVITFKTRAIGDSLLYKMMSSLRHHKLALTKTSYNDHTLVTQAIPLRDANKRDVGSLLLFKDATARIEHSRRDIVITGALTVALSCILLGLFYFITGSMEQRLWSSRSKLVESEERFRSLVESSSDWIWEVDTQGVYTYASPKILEILGYTPEEVIGKTPFDLMPADEGERVRAIFNDVVASRKPCNALANTNHHKNGQLVILETNAVPVFNAAGILTGYRGMDRVVTGRKQAEEAIRQSEASLAEAQRIARLGSWDWDIVHERICWSSEAYRIFGVPPQQACITYETFLETVHPEDRASVIQAVNDTLQQHKPYDIEYRIIHPSGHERLVHARGEVTFDDEGNPFHMIGTVQDITELKLTELQLRQAAKVFEHTSEGVIITGPDQRIVAVNRAFTRITGYSEKEVKGQKPKILRSGRHDDEFYRQMWTAIKATGLWQGEIWNRRKNGVEYPEWLNISEVRDEADAIVNYIGVFADISLIKESQHKLEHTAHHDALTGLPNRLLFRDRLEQGLAAAHRNGKGVAVLFLDLDRFKVINDTLGHETGDLLLQEVAQRLLHCLREDDTVARMGGDEFVVIQKGVDSPDDAALLATRILRQISRPLSLVGHEMVVTLSIGISLYPQDGKNVSALLKNADAAMYRAKDMGRNCYQYYSNEMTASGLARLELESDLRQALERNEFVLHYQPQINLKNGEITGVEALIRWQHPHQGMISPVVFIPLAEDIGMIGAIGEWVLNTACIDAKAWQAAGLPPLRLAVNISGRQFSNDGVVDQVTAALQNSGLLPHYLEIEITESAIMKDAARGISTLNALKKLGVYLAIDDFGTGYSSLSYLKRFPIDKLKIDKSFIDGLPKEQDDAAISTAIIAMAHSLRLTVIAEGVETEAQLAFLRSNACDEIQGYLFSKALPADRLVELLSNTQPFVLAAKS